MIDRLSNKAISKREYLNETYIEVRKEDLRDICIKASLLAKSAPRVMFANDERSIDGVFRIYTVFSRMGFNEFIIIVLSVNPDSPEFPSLTKDLPSVNWYEREIKDMFGLEPKGHPDSRRLVFHNSFPLNSYPLRKDWSISNEDLKEWGEGRLDKSGDRFMEVEGEGVYEIPVGPVHAGIIEPGHFRFSAVGETIFFLEPRLFYTHKGIEKQFEKIGFIEGVKLAERVSGTSTLAHAAAYCMAVERMAGVEVSEKANAIRTLLLELERIYNHIGDIGNMCAGTGLQVGYAKGAVIKERLVQLNSRICGSRYLRGAIVPGGATKDIFENRDDILNTIETATKEYKELMSLLLDCISHVERLENTGILSREIARKLGVTGVAARASGLEDDIRKSHPHFSYDGLEFESHTRGKGDVFARMLVRADETQCSISLINSLLENSYRGDLKVEITEIPPLASALGYTESPRGSVFYWVMSGKNGHPLRVKLRSPSFCNWPAVPFAVHGNIVPDFPLCNKSFNLSYSGCDM